MSKMKEMVVKGMNMVMLDCDRATYLATKNEIESVGCVQRMQLKMHLMGCKFCRTYSKQSNLINKQMDNMKELDTDNLLLHLTGEQKNRLQQTVEKHNTL